MAAGIVLSIWHEISRATDPLSMGEDGPMWPKTRDFSRKPLLHTTYQLDPIEKPCKYSGHIPKPSHELEVMINFLSPVVQF